MVAVQIMLTDVFRGALFWEACHLLTSANVLSWRKRNKTQLLDSRLLSMSVQQHRARLSATQICYIIPATLGRVTLPHWGG
jgi:hypothetical protein